jgi:hypothetical protein
MIIPFGSTGPLVAAANLVEEDNTFAAGQLVAITSSGFELADNTVKSKPAIGYVFDAFATAFWLMTIAGTVVDYAEHGFGAAGTKLWLGTTGGIVTSEPTGASAVVIQVVGQVLDADRILLQFHPPVILT